MSYFNFLMKEKIVSPNSIYDRNNINHFIFLKEEKKKDQTLFESVVSVHVLYLVLCSTYYNLSCIFIIFLIK